MSLQSKHAILETNSILLLIGVLGLMFFLIVLPTINFNNKLCFIT